jgi:hypothetical protein
MERTRRITATAAAIGLLCLLTLPASAAAQDQNPVARAHTQAMIEELGLRESATPVRERAGWRKPGKVVVFVDKPERLAALQAVAPGVEIVAVDSQAEAVSAVADAEVLLGSCAEEILSQGPQLHWIQVYSAGVDSCMGNPGLEQGDRILTNGQKIGSPALAEHAIAMMMALVRALDVYHANQLNGTWQRDVGMDRREFMELDGRTGWACA